MPDESENQTQRMAGFALLVVAFIAYIAWFVGVIGFEFGAMTIMMMATCLAFLGGRP